MKLKTIVILGTVHEYQRNGHVRNAELGQRITHLQEKFNVEVVLEEWTPKERASFLHGWSNDRVLHWADVGTGDDEKFQTYVCPPINHPGHDGTLGPDLDAPSMSEYGPLPAHENREKQMVAHVKQVMSAYQCGLLILGIAHLHSMSVKLTSEGYRVVTYSWFRLG